jgi:hypothetical protein
MDATFGRRKSAPMFPLSEMFGYASDLRSKTQGRGQYVMEPIHYVEVPKFIARKSSRTAEAVMDSICILHFRGILLKYFVLRKIRITIQNAKL